MRKSYAIFFVIIIFIGIPQMVLADERKLEIEVVDTTGSWITTTPMFMETASSGSYKQVVVNATNINSTDVLNDFQYLKFIFDYIEYEEPTVSKTDIVYKFDLEMNFTDIDTKIKISYNWELEWDTGVVIYEGWLFIFIDDVLAVSINESGYDDTHELEIHIWRTKSNQIAVYYELNDEHDLKLYNPLSNWDIGNFTYWFEDEAGYTGTFTVRFNDLSIQSGTNEGIQDPIENTDWGFFDPIRQILLFILNVFIGVVRVVLPDSIEDFFDEMIDAIGDVAEPLTELTIFIFDNYLDLIILGNLALLLAGIQKAEEGDIGGALMPFFTFYGFFFSIAFKVIGFIVSVINAIVSALPL